MVKKSTKILTLVFAAALALVLFVGAPSDSSEGAGTAIVIDGVTTTWADYPTPLLLNDGDILTIAAAAGSPAAGDYVIQIAQDANVVINGAGNVINHVRLCDDSGDTVTHTVTLNNVKFNTTHAEGYFHVKGVLVLIQDNSITSDATGIYSTSNPVTINSTAGGSLTVKSNLQRAINCVGSLSIQGSAKVTAVGGSGVPVFNLGSGYISMQPGATLVVTNNSVSAEKQQFRMSSPGNQWVLAAATLSLGELITDNVVNITVLSTKTGTIVLASQPNIAGDTVKTLVAGYAATSSDAFDVEGSPKPTVTKLSGNPSITWNPTTMKLDIAAGLAAGTYAVQLKADNGFDPFVTLTWTLTVSPATVTAVTVAPATPSVMKGETQQFTATVTGTGGFATTVNWSVTGGVAGTSISATGLLTVAADETATSLTVTATSTMDSTKTGTATVTVTSEEPGGGGSSALLWVAIIIVVVVVILALLYFFVLKKKP